MIKKLYICSIQKQIKHTIMILLNFTLKLVAFSLTALAASGIVWAIFALLSGAFENATFGILG